MFADACRVEISCMEGHWMFADVCRVEISCMEGRWMVDDAWDEHVDRCIHGMSGLSSAL